MDIGNFIADISIHKADGYFLITDTRLSTKTEEHISGVNRDTSSPYKVTYWGIRDLENKLVEKMRMYYIIF
jgi:hypothetical protein